MAVQEQIESLWYRIAELTPGTEINRLSLGQCFHELRFLYSDRNSGGRRLSSGHGTFEIEIRKRTKYSPRAVRDMIADYLANLCGGPSTTAKRKARRFSKVSSSPDPLTEFARLLPFKAVRSAYRVAALLLHPDHGGSTERMQELNHAWKRVEVSFNEHGR